MDTKTAWQNANLMDAIQVRTLVADEAAEKRKGSCPFCGSEASLYAYSQGGFHCFGECGGPSGQTYTNTEVVAKVHEVSLGEARAMICDLEAV